LEDGVEMERVILRLGCCEYTAVLAEMFIHLTVKWLLLEGIGPLPGRLSRRVESMARQKFTGSGLGSMEMVSKPGTNASQLGGNQQPSSTNVSPMTN
jgi:hypothetical protein